MTEDYSPGTDALRVGAAAHEILDTGDGIDRVMGDHELYARTLRRFRKDYGEVDRRIRAALAAGDTPLAHHLSHTVKGAAGMIGAHRVHWHASALETALRLKTGNEMACIDALAPALGDVLRVLDGLLDVAPAMPPASHPPRTPLGDPVLLTRLLDLLMNGDGSAIDLLEESEASLRAILGNTRFDEVSAAANEFDYERALATLRRPIGAA